MSFAIQTKKRLIAVIQREGLSLERERMAEWTIAKITPEILKIIAEEVRILDRQREIKREKA